MINDAICKLKYSTQIALKLISENIFISNFIKLNVGFRTLQITSTPRRSISVTPPNTTYGITEIKYCVEKKNFRRKYFIFIFLIPIQ